MAPPQNLHMVAQQAARQFGLGDWFVRQIGQESRFQAAPSGRGPNGEVLPNSSGAAGPAQVVARWHPDAPPPSDAVGQIRWAAKYMAGLVRQYGSVPKALSVYNSGKPDAYKDPNFAGGQTFHYVKSIMGGAVPSATPPLPVAAAAPTLPPGGGTPPAAPRGLSAGLLQAVNAGNEMFGLAALPQSLLTAPVPAAAPTLAAPPLKPLNQKLVPTAPGWVSVAGGANRKGMALQPSVVSFVGQVAQRYGKPLTIGTGTNHNEYVAGSHRESDHWTGYAADIPASGAALTRLGQAALIAAGADPAWAHRQQGGLFNIGNKQVIFNSNVGGNHFTHLHVGLRSR